MSKQASAVAEYLSHHGPTPCKSLQQVFGRLPATRGYIELAADYGYTITTDFVAVPPNE